MEVEFRINGVIKSLDVAANESLLAALRREGYYSVKHGCEAGECGACTVLIDGMPRPACVTFAAQVGGCTLTTVESLGTSEALHPLQQAFVDSGAVSCGFCTPGMILSAYALLKQDPNPDEEAVRDALSGNLCRCTGYAKPVEAVMRAAGIMRGETAEAVGAERSIDAVKLVTGKAAFADDIELRGTLYGRLLTSPHAHAVIRDIDISEARALPGVHAVLTYRDIPRIPYAGAGASSDGTELRDQYSLDYIVRFAGDRVAAVAAETPEIAEQALHLIRVKYETLPALLDPRKAIEPGAVRLHSETESSGIYDAAHNIAAHLSADAGNVERGFAEADLVIEGDYIIPNSHSSTIENHIAITYLDEDDRLVVRTSAESAHAVQHIIAPLVDLPAHRIRVVSPRTGGSFGAKRGMLVEDICARLTLTTRKPVRIEYSRADEFHSSRVCPSQVIHLKTGVKRDGTLIANQMSVLASAGAYSSQAVEMLRAMAVDMLPLYPCPNMHFEADAIYTNLPPAGVFPGDASQALFALESHMDEIAKQAGIDALELRRRNMIRSGDENPLAKVLSENGESGMGGGKNGNETFSIERCELSQCVRIVEEKLGWREKRGRGGTGRYRRGTGVALAMHGAPAPGVSGKSGVSIKLNEDGSFAVLVGATTAGDGSHTIIAQVAAEALGVRHEDVAIQACDTDVTPFESGADAALSTRAAINVVMKAAGQARVQVLEAAGRMLEVDPGTLALADRVITALNGDTVTIAQVAHHSLYSPQESPIMTVAVEAHARPSPSFAAQGAEVEVDTETGAVRVLRAITAVDAGRIINPLIAEGQAEGGIARELGRAISEEMLYDQHGAPLTTGLSDYRIYSALDMPQMETCFVEAGDASGANTPGAITTGGMAAAIANAVSDALGVRVRQLPLTPERVLKAIRAQAR